MNRKKPISILALALVMASCFALGASASGALQEIKAYLDPSITIKLEGEAQTFLDAKGNRVYPITYEGSTYLPVRAVAGLAGYEVNWDQATRTVDLGETKGVDLIETYEHYYSTNRAGQVRTADKKTENISGISCSHWLYMNAWNANEMQVSFNLLGKHETLTFSYYCDKDITLKVLGDNGYVLGEYNITGSASAKTVTIPLLGTNELTFYSDMPPTSNLRIFNAYLDAEG
jgi:hypothetical protein